MRISDWSSDVCSSDLFMEEWLSLYSSKSGERGIFNREAAQKHVEKFGRRTASLMNPSQPGSMIQFGTNPCGEIILRPKQFCNLSTMEIGRASCRIRVCQYV